MVYGCDKDGIMRINGTYSLHILESVPYNVVCIMVINLALILILALLFGYRFSGLLSRLLAVSRASQGMRVFHWQKGIADRLRQKLDQTSRILLEQNQRLAKRDHARTNWISGSFTISLYRFPLIMGYADTLVRDHSMGERAKEEGGLHPASEPYD